LGPVEYCVYYDGGSLSLRGFLPANMDERLKTRLRILWESEIPRKILMALSEDDELTTPELQQAIGHSMSTLHENIKKLQDAGLIEAKMSYVKNKKKVLTTKVLCVTQNPKLAAKLKGFLNKGLWVDSKKSKRIVRFLDDNPGVDFTVPEIASRTKIPADEVETLLTNWDAQITRAFSDFLKAVPFQKKVFYRSLKKR
jgi:DNA-binding Lrp family transcriptional regulator